MTGVASRGIGRATADRMASDGWSSPSSTSTATPGSAAAEIGGNRSVQCSASQPTWPIDSVEAAITQVETTLPPIIALANLAGVSPRSTS